MTSTPYRQIRALWDVDTITVYQAYSSAIASAAVTAQKLSASPTFSLDRMTWIKPSWCWMMYRCGYSYKDKRQERVLALRMKHEHFQKLLEGAVLSDETSAKPKAEQARVQWDPERDVRLEKLPHRSIQIGIPAALTKTWIEEWIYSIEDVTDRARGLKKALEENPDIDLEKLISMGFMTQEKVYDIPKTLAVQLGMVSE